MKRPKRVRHYRMWKNGESVLVQSDGKDLFEKNDDHVMPISADRVFAVDTESAFKRGELVTDLVQIAFDGETIVLDDEESRVRILERFLYEVLKRYGVPAGRLSRTKQRKRRPRSIGIPKRDGRRSKVPLVLSVWFNLPYDIGRLFSKTDELRAIHAGADAFIMKLGGGLSIEWLRYVDKSAAQFHWMIRDVDQDLVCNLFGLDLTGYWKCSLHAAATALGGEGKDDLEAIVPLVHERPFESFSTFERGARRSYAVKDVEQTAFVYRRTVDELMRIDPRVIMKNGLIPPSAPGAAAKIMFARAFDAHPNIDHWRRPPLWADQLGANAYFGGRAFAARPGIYLRGGLQTLDLKSAYPAAMAMLPDPVTAEYLPVRKRDFDLDRFRGKYGVLVVSGRCHDARYPAFRTHTPMTGRLRYVAGNFHKVAVSIPELVIGACRGALDISEVHDGVVVEGSCSSSFMRRTVLELYDLKEREGKSPLGMLAKLFMNSPYGKLIEVVVRELRTHGALAVPSFTNHIPEIAASIVRLDIEPDADPAALFFAEDEGKASELRALYELRTDPGVQAYVDTLSTFHAYDGGVALRDFVHKARTWRTGRYFMPIYASQITGFVSAQLGAMASCVDALCGDTDSVHFPCVGAVEEDPRLGAYWAIMAHAGYPAPRPGHDIREGCSLGRWAADSPGASVESVIVRPKVYSHKFVSPDGAVSYKQAFHGLAKFTCVEAEMVRKDGSRPREERDALARALRQENLHEQMKALLRNEPVAYLTKPSPRRGRAAAISGETVGEFSSRIVAINNPPVFGTTLEPSGWVRWDEESFAESMAAE